MRQVRRGRLQAILQLFRKLRFFEVLSECESHLSCERNIDRSMQRDTCTRVGHEHAQCSAVFIRKYGVQEADR